MPRDGISPDHSVPLRLAGLENKGEGGDPVFPECARPAKHIPYLSGTLRSWKEGGGGGGVIVIRKGQAKVW